MWCLEFMDCMEGSFVTSGPLFKSRYPEYFCFFLFSNFAFMGGGRWNGGRGRSGCIVLLILLVYVESGGWGTIFGIVTLQDSRVAISN